MVKQKPLDFEVILLRRRQRQESCERVYPSVGPSVCFSVRLIRPNDITAVNVTFVEKARTTNDASFCTDSLCIDCDCIYARDGMLSVADYNSTLMGVVVVVVVVVALFRNGIT